MDKTYYILYKASGHNIVNTVQAGSDEEVRLEILPDFVVASDNDIASFTINSEVARQWEASCYHIKRETTN